MLDLDISVVEESKDEQRTTYYKQFEKYFDKFDHRYFKPLHDLSNSVETLVVKPREEQEELEFAGKMWCWFCKKTVQGQKNLIIHLVEHRYCGFCKTKFDTSESKWFVNHMLDVHQFEIPTITFRRNEGNKNTKKMISKTIYPTIQPSNFKCSKCSGKSLSESLFASTNPQYDDRLFIEL